MREATLQPGRQVGTFQLEALLGEGAAGLVFRATAASGREVALKILRPELARDERAIHRFRREAQLAGEIESAHLVPILELGESEQLVFLVMPYYGGGSLAARLRSGGPLDVGATTDIAAQLAQALDALHAQGVIHRDVKPSNALIDARGTYALGDYGLARGTDSTRLTADGQILGTPAYLAPELIEGGDASERSDIYALACLLYECLTGEPPFTGQSAAEVGFAQLTEPPPDPRVLSPELPAGVTDALHAALAKEPAERPTTATALARMLHVAGSSSPR